jgi:hypothetical protein
MKTNAAQFPSSGTLLTRLLIDGALASRCILNHVRILTRLLVKDCQDSADYLAFAISEQIRVMINQHKPFLQRFLRMKHMWIVRPHAKPRDVRRLWTRPYFAAKKTWKPWRRHSLIAKLTELGIRIPSTLCRKCRTVVIPFRVR